MRTSLTELEHALDGVEAVLRASALLDEVLAKAPDALTKQLAATYGGVNVRREFEYSGAIVSIYGAFERFVERLLVGYMRRLSGAHARYGYLPENLRAKYERLVGELLVRMAGGREDDVTLRDVVRDLHACFGSNGPYRLVEHAYVHHTANFRREVVDKFFADVGRERVCEDVLGDREFMQEISALALGSAHGKGPLWVLDDLAERRNRVAHGNPEENRLSADYLLQYLAFVKAFCRGLFRAVGLRCEAIYSAMCLGNPYAVLKSGTVVCLELGGGVVLTVGTSVIAVSPGFGWCERKVVSIEVNKSSMTELVAIGPTKVGLGLNASLGRNCTLYLPHQTPS